MTDGFSRTRRLSLLPLSFNITGDGYEIKLGVELGPIAVAVQEKNLIV